MLQFISHYTDKHTYLDSIKMALEGGCKWVQLRMKDHTTEEIRPVAIEAQILCRNAGATFIIDDNVLLVKELNADGVHLGKNDMPISEARKILGKDFIIGGTANSFEDVMRHYNDGANYIGCGPFRFTTTKKNLSEILGADGYKDIVNSMRANNIDIPIVAIGGITFNDIPTIMSTGVNGIALSGTVLRADNPVKEMERLIAMVGA